MIFAKCRLTACSLLSPSLPSSPEPPSSLLPPSGCVSHLFSATAIRHGLDTRVLLQRNPYNRLTVIKETSLQSNKISNFQPTRDAFRLVVLFSEFIFFLPCMFLLYPVFFFLNSLVIYFIRLTHVLFLEHFKSKCYIQVPSKKKQSFNYLCCESLPSFFNLSAKEFVMCTFFSFL